MRRYQTRLTLWIALALGMLCHLGCSEAPVANQQGTPATQIAAGGTGEIEHTYATCGQLDGGLVVVVWFDLEVVRCSSGTSSSDTAEFHGDHAEAPERQIRWHGQVKSDSTGTVTVNGQDYELTEGRLILATIISGRPAVRQLKYGVDQFGDGDLPESLRGCSRRKA